LGTHVIPDDAKVELAVAWHRALARVTWDRVRRSAASPATGAIGALVLMGVAWSFATPYFLDPGNLLDVSRQMTTLALMAIGVTFVLLGGQIDLSVGSTYGLVTVVFALLLSQGYGLAFAIVAALVVAGAVGLMNGLLAAYLRLPSFIVTLGSLEAVRGITLQVTDGAPINLFNNTTAGFATFAYLGQARLFGLFPSQFVVLIAVLVITGLFLSFTRYGLRLYAVGANSRAAALAGIKVARIQTIAFVVSGSLAGLAALLGVAFIPAVTPTAGSGLELNVFAAAVLGGVSLFGGQGSVVGAVLGAALLAVLGNGLVILGVSSFAQTTATGVVIIAAIAVNVLITRRRNQSS
jgi:ribose transport system permease protein